MPSPPVSTNDCTVIAASGTSTVTVNQSTMNRTNGELYRRAIRRRAERGGKIHACGGVDQNRQGCAEPGYALFDQGGAEEEKDQNTVDAGAQ